MGCESCKMLSTHTLSYLTSKELRQTRLPVIVIFSGIKSVSFMFKKKKKKLQLSRTAGSTHTWLLHLEVCVRAPSPVLQLPAASSVPAPLAPSSLLWPWQGRGGIEAGQTVHSAFSLSHKGNRSVCAAGRHERCQEAHWLAQQYSSNLFAVIYSIVTCIRWTLIVLCWSMYTQSATCTLLTKWLQYFLSGVAGYTKEKQKYINAEAPARPIKSTSLC